MDYNSPTARITRFFVYLLAVSVPMIIGLAVVGTTPYLLDKVPEQHRDTVAAIGDGGGAVLGRASTRQMCTNQLTPEQRKGADALLEPGAGWGHHVEVRADGLVGWAGGRGTIGYVDPAGGR